MFHPKHVELFAENKTPYKKVSSCWNIFKKLNGYSLLRRNCLLKHVVEEKIYGRAVVTGRRGRRCKKLLDDRTEMIGYWKLKQEALDRNLLTTRFGRGYGPIARQTMK
jgi:hypothetical protein